MELLNSNLVLAMCISFVYFVLKMVIEKKKDIEIKKKIFKDSVFVGIISYAVLIFRSNFVSFETAKAATIFTNEPQF
jgi:hypothetical protein